MFEGGLLPYRHMWLETWGKGSVQYARSSSQGDLQMKPVRGVNQGMPRSWGGNLLFVNRKRDPEGSMNEATGGEEGRKENRLSERILFKKSQDASD